MDGKVEEIPSAGTIRLEEEVIQTTHTMQGVVLKKVKYGSADLPPRREGVFFIVSKMVADNFPKRSDLVFPYDVVRDDEGNIIGCKSFGRTYYGSE